MENAVKIDVYEQAAVVTLNKPKSYNSFDLAMIHRMGERLSQLALDKEIVGVVISGAGNAFCAGGDLRWLAGYSQNYGSAFHELAAKFHQAILEIRNMPKPVIAAINGLAAGGGFSMALACDFRIMEDPAILRQGYTSNGLSIDGGGTYTLPRLVGVARALEIATFDPPIRAKQAESWGLVTEVVKAGESLRRAVELITEIKRKSLSSFTASKRLINESFNTSFETQLEKERDFLSWCGDHPNGREGISAFLEKRPAHFNKD
jgi:2-(1,2-epoxy-1,2-dihydrophenyl)acetyl-CoA isomerase